MQAFLWVVPFSTNLGLSLWWENTVGRGSNLPSRPSNNQPPHKSKLVLEQLDPRLSQYATSCSTSSDLIEKRGLSSTCTFLPLSLSNKWQSLPLIRRGKQPRQSDSNYRLSPHHTPFLAAFASHPYNHFQRLFSDVFSPVLEYRYSRTTCQWSCDTVLLQLKCWVVPTEPQRPVKLKWLTP